MTTINLKTYNQKIIDSIVKKMREIIVRGSKSENTEKIDDYIIDVNDINDFKNLNELGEILHKDITIDDENIYLFQEVAVKASEYNYFMHILYEENPGIEIPKSLTVYGIIPGLNIKTPRPKFVLESMEDYENYLKDFYKKYDIIPELDEEGIRKPYPHEKYKWKDGKALKVSDDYTISYYSNYRASKLKEKLLNNNSNHENNTNNNSNKKNETKEKRSETFKRRTYNNPKKRHHATTGRRYRVTKIKSLTDWLKELPKKARNLDLALGKDEVLVNVGTGVKRTALVAAIIALGIVSLKYFIPFLGLNISALGKIPQILLPALTGSGISASGTVYTTTQISLMRKALVNLLIEIGGISTITAVIVHQKRKAKKQANNQENIDEINQENIDEEELESTLKKEQDIDLTNINIDDILEESHKQQTTPKQNQAEQSKSSPNHQNTKENSYSKIIDGIDERIKKIRNLQNNIEGLLKNGSLTPEEKKKYEDELKDLDNKMDKLYSMILQADTYYQSFQDQLNNFDNELNENKTGGMSL